MMAGADHTGNCELTKKSEFLPLAQGRLESMSPLEMAGLMSVQRGQKKKPTNK